MRRIPILAVLVLLTSCARTVTVQDPALAVEIKIAQALNGISNACGDTLTLVQTMMPDQSEDRRAIVNTVTAIVKANIAARQALEAISKGPKTTPAEVIASMRPAVQSIAKSLQDGFLGIKNPETKKQFMIWLLAVSAALNTTQAILEVQNNG